MRSRPGGQGAPADEALRKPSTIKDVAAHAGVGVGTVSRVMNNHPSVTPATRERVRASVSALAYRPNRAARMLSRRHAGAIGVLIPFFTHPSAVERLRGVSGVLDRTSFDLVLFATDHPERRHERLLQAIHRDLVDGLLLVSLPLDRADTTFVASCGIPAVAVDVELPGLPAVVVDDVEGGRIAARHLLGLGHRRIGYIGDAVDPGSGFTSSMRRRAGLALELADHGLTLDPAMVREQRHGQDTARRAAIDLLQRPDRPSAIFAHADLQALGVLAAAAELGLDVPGDLSVIGFDDVEAARLAGLTTVRQPLVESGRLGATRLLAMLAHPDPSDPDDQPDRAGDRPGDRMTVPLDLVIRRTTAPLTAYGSHSSPAHEAHRRSA